jgi:hypothetical protein
MSASALLSLMYRLPAHHYRKIQPARWPGRYPQGFENQKSRMEDKQERELEK